MTMSESLESQATTGLIIRRMVHKEIDSNFAHKVRGEEDQISFEKQEERWLPEAVVLPLLKKKKDQIIDLIEEHNTCAIQLEKQIVDSKKLWKADIEVSKKQELFMDLKIKGLEKRFSTIQKQLPSAMTRLKDDLAMFLRDYGLHSIAHGKLLELVDEWVERELADLLKEDVGSEVKEK